MSKIVVDTSAQQDGDAIQTVSTKDSDPANTVVTKDYLSSKIQAIPKLDAYTKTEVNNLLGNKLDKNGTAVKAQDSDKLANKPASDYALKTEVMGGMPIGSYLMWPSLSYTPNGFLPCDGQLLKKADYPELYELLGETYGGGGDSFGVPKFNDGRFVRGIGGNAATMGVAQNDAMRNITGWLAVMSNDVRQADGAFYMDDIMSTGFNDGTSDPVYRVRFDASRQVPTANENRPYNSCVKWLIKCKNSKLYSSLDKSLIATESQPGVFKVKPQINGSATDATVTEKAIVDKLFGYGQSWKNVSADRHTNVTYYNDTGKPIFVAARMVAASQGGASSVIGAIGENEILCNYAARMPGVTVNMSVSFIVGPGDPYKIISAYTLDAGKQDPTSWFEYR